MFRVLFDPGGSISHFLSVVPGRSVLLLVDPFLIVQLSFSSCCFKVVHFIILFCFIGSVKCSAVRVSFVASKVPKFP